MKRIVTLHLSVEYDPKKTDPEGLCNAYDKLLETAKSALGSGTVMDEYGNPKETEFTYDDQTDVPVADTPQVPNGYVKSSEDEPCRDCEGTDGKCIYRKAEGKAWDCKQDYADDDDPDEEEEDEDEDEDEDEEARQERLSSRPAEAPVRPLPPTPRPAIGLIECRFLMYLVRAMQAHGEMLSGGCKPTIDELRYHQPVSVQDVKIKDEQAVRSRTATMTQHLKMADETAENIGKELDAYQKSLELYYAAQAKFEKDWADYRRRAEARSTVTLDMGRLRREGSLDIKGDGGFMPPAPYVHSSHMVPCAVCGGTNGNCFFKNDRRVIKEGDWACELADQLEREELEEEDEDEEEAIEEAARKDPKPDQPKDLEDAKRRADANVKAIKKLKGKKARKLLLAIIERGCIRTQVDPVYGERCEETCVNTAQFCVVCTQYYELGLELPDWPKRKQPRTTIASWAPLAEHVQNDIPDSASYISKEGKK